MSIKIQVDPARLDSAAGQIEQQTLSYEKNYRRLFQEVAAMGSGWQGKDNQAFVSQIQGFEKDFQQMAALMREYPGGCVNGGGQPQQPGSVRNTVDIRALRAKVLYDEDAAKTIRKSHENPAIKELYETYLGKPGSEKAHHLLHTTYVKRKINEV